MFLCENVRQKIILRGCQEMTYCAKCGEFAGLGDVHCAGCGAELEPGKHMAPGEAAEFARKVLNDEALLPNAGRGAVLLGMACCDNFLDILNDPIVIRNAEDE